MNQDSTILTHMRWALDRQFTDFVDQVGLTQDDFRPASVDSTQLVATARQCLSTLDRFRAWIPPLPTSEIEDQLRGCVSVAAELSEVRFLLKLLNDALAPEVTGSELVLQRGQLRIQRYERKLTRLRQKLAAQRLGVQVKRLTAGLGYDGDEPEPDFAQFTRQAVITAFRQLVDQLDFDEPSFAFFYESSANLQRLRQVLEEFADACNDDQWGVLINDVRDLEWQTARYVDYAAVRMRCTKWLEMSRTSDESQALRALASVAIERGESIYGQLMERWNQDLVSEMQAKLERSLGTS